MSFAHPEDCAICGHVTRSDLRWSLVHWRDAAPGMGYEHVGACADREACRRRVAAQGDVWPLVENTATSQSA